MSRRKDNTVKLGDAIQQLLKQEKLDVKMSRFAVKNAWADIAGKLIANHSTQLFFDEKKNLFLELDSAPLKNEVFYQRSELVKKINAFCGYELITQIIIR